MSPINNLKMNLFSVQHHSVFQSLSYSVKTTNYIYFSKQLQCSSDPAIASLQHQFSRTTCQTVRGRYRQGKVNCGWTSCREGCTHEVYNCWQIEVIIIIINMFIMFICQVKYDVYDHNYTVVDTVPAKLYPNVKGCGYPPIVDCDGSNSKLCPEQTGSIWETPYNSVIFEEALDRYS